MAKSGLSLIKPESISFTGSGSSASISTNGTVTFTSCDTVSFNNVFSNIYTNYQLIIRTSTTSTPRTVNFTLRKYGVDELSNTYEYHLCSAYESSISQYIQSNSPYIQGGSASSGVPCGHIVWVFYPYLEKMTSIRWIDTGPWSPGGYPAYTINATATNTKQTSYDGFSIQTGPMSGTLSVYGFRQ